MPDYNLGTAHGEVVLDSDTKGLDDANKKVDETKKKAEESGESADKLATGFAVAGAAVAAGFAVAVNSAADFEHRMSAVKAVSGASQAEMETLRNKALQLGKDTSFSAAESALAIEELAKAGISVPDIMNGAADATVNLAAAGEVALPRAAEIASDAMNSFGLSAKELPRVADIFAGAANVSSIGVEELAQSMTQASAVAHLAGLSFEDTATAIALMGNAGIKGSDAGTSLKTMLQNLNPTTEKQIGLAKELGIVTEDGANAFFDATGKAKGLSGIAAVLQSALKGQTQQQKLATLETLFGTDAIRAAAIVATAGAKGVNELSASIEKVSAAEVAAERLNNFKGSLEQAKGSAETLAIQIGTPLLAAFRSAADAVTSVLNAFLNLNEATRKVLTGVGLLVGGFALTAAASFKLIGTISGIKNAVQGAITAFQNLGRAGKIATISMGAIGIALTILGVAYAAMSGKNAEAKGRVDALTDSLDAQSGALTGASKKLLYAAAQQEGLADKADKAGISQKDLLDAIISGGPVLDKVVRQYGEFQGANEDVSSQQRAAEDATQRFRDALVGQTGELGNARKNFKQFTEAGLVPAADATGQLTEKQIAQNQELQQAAAAAQAYQEELKAIVDNLILMGEITLSARDAERNYQAALDAATQALKDNGITLDDNTEKGRANNEALDGIAEATLSQIEAMGKSVDVNGQAVFTQDELNGKLVRGASDLYAAATAYGMSKKAADAYVQSIFGIPGSKATKLIADKQKAEANIKSLKRQLADKNLTKERRAKLTADKKRAEAALKSANEALTNWGQRSETATARVEADLSPLQRALNQYRPSFVVAAVPGRSEGGRIRGRRGKDRAGLYALEHDEFVIKAASAREVGYDNLERINRGDLSALPIATIAGSSRSVNPVVAAKQGAQIIQNIYNPINEPTSVTTNRELQRLSALGVL